MGQRVHTHRLLEEVVEDTDSVDVSPGILEDTVEKFGRSRSGGVGSKSLPISGRLMS